jgi:hypothetical protein
MTWITEVLEKRFSNNNVAPAHFGELLAAYEGKASIVATAPGVVRSAARTVDRGSARNHQPKPRRRHVFLRVKSRHHRLAWVPHQPEVGQKGAVGYDGSTLDLGQCIRHPNPIVCTGQGTR